MSNPRPRILFAWEAGGNFGHAAKIIAVADALGDRAETIVAAKDPTVFREIAPDQSLAILPAPVAPPRPVDRPGVSFADDLRHIGWDKPRALAALVSSWSTLIDLVEPDLVTTQAAPTALLACRGTKRPLASFGSGYDCPPRTSPAPPFFFWTEGAEAETATREAAILDTANAALALLGRPPLNAVSDIFEGVEHIVASFPEIDAYAPRNRFEPIEDNDYIGKLFVVDAGTKFDWRAGADVRCLMYVRPDHASGRAAVQAAAALPENWDVVVAAPGLSDADAATYARPHLRLIDGPVRLDRLLPDCDVGVNHGSNGIAGAFVSAGAPQVCLPTHAEQVMTSRALAIHGLALGLLGSYGADQIKDAILKAVSLPNLRQNARLTAARLDARDQLRPAERIAERLLAAVQPGREGG